MSLIYLNFYPKDHIYSNKIAGFDMDGTLIKPKSRFKFPVDKDDWKFLNESIITKLSSIKDTIIIFSNQKGISKGHTKESDIIDKVKQIHSKLNIPFIFLASKEDDINRKPRIGMYEFIDSELNIKFDKKNSYYVGDMAGREKDKDDTDRKFALNLKFKFYTPEEYFLNKPTEEYKLNGYQLNSKNTKSNICSINDNEIVLISGYPGSGKTYLANQMSKVNNSKFFSHDKDGPKFMKLVEESLKNKFPTIVEGLFASNESRNKILVLAKKYNYNTRLIQMETPLELAYHLNVYRSLYEDKKRIPMVVYHTYNKNYESPIVNDWNSIELFMPSILDKHNKYFLY